MLEQIEGRAGKDKTGIAGGDDGAGIKLFTRVVLRAYGCALRAELDDADELVQAGKRAFQQERCPVGRGGRAGDHIGRQIIPLDGERRVEAIQRKEKRIPYLFESPTEVAAAIGQGLQAKEHIRKHIGLLYHAKGIRAQTTS